MPVTITTVKGVGGSPPTHIHAEGTVQGCETLRLECSCYRGTPISYPIPAGGLTTWSFDFVNNLGCQCGANVTVTATCDLGMPSSSTATYGPLPLDCCPDITIDPPVPSQQCVGFQRPVTLTIHIAQPPAGITILHWETIPGTYQATQTIMGPAPATGLSNTYNYPQPGPYTSILHVDYPLGCPSQQLIVGPLVACACPTITVNAVPQECHGTRRRVELSADITVPPGQTAQFAWDYGDPPSPQGPTFQVNIGFDNDLAQHHTC